MTIPVKAFLHFNLNCSVLARSRAFYEQALGLQAANSMTPADQDGSGFGIPGPVRFDGNFLRDGQPWGRGPGLDLLEWTRPRLADPPYGEPHHLGIVRIVYATPDVEAAHARVKGHGFRTLSPPVRLPGSDLSRFCLVDPDGVQVELRQGEADRFAGIVVNCSDLERSAALCQDLLGMEVAEATEVGPVPGGLYGLSGNMDWRSRSLKLPGDRNKTFALELVQWKNPRPVGTPYTEAFHLGLFRIAMGVDDLDAAYREILAAGVECFAPPADIVIGPPPESRSVRALFFKDPDGACLEFIERARRGT